jgi:hypothetical protein
MYSPITLLFREKRREEKCNRERREVLVYSVDREEGLSIGVK